MADSEVFKANDKEIRLFEKEKLDLYKGTFVVCIVYGLAAFILLAVILLTQWGKEYIYDKFAPAVITYILGSLVIILYLLNTIYTLRPRRVGKDAENDENIICPDYWKLEVVPMADQKKIVTNNLENLDSSRAKKALIPEIAREENAALRYRCVYDKKVYGEPGELRDMKNIIHKKDGAGSATVSFLPGFKTATVATSYTDSSTKTTKPDYSIKIPDNSATNYKDIQKYAKFSGIYNNADTTTSDSGFAFAIGKSGYAVTPNSTPAVLGPAVVTKYNTETPLNCDVVYPKVLGVLDEKTKEGNEVSCEYAKQCGISWSSLNCKK